MVVKKPVTVHKKIPHHHEIDHQNAAHRPGESSVQLVNLDSDENRRLYDRKPGSPRFAPPEGHPLDEVQRPVDD